MISYQNCKKKQDFDMKKPFFLKSVLSFTEPLILGRIFGRLAARIRNYLKAHRPAGRFKRKQTV